MTGLHIAPDFELPVDAATTTQAILAKKGDDLNALAEHHRRIGITARDARALKRVAALITAHDEHAEVDVAS